MTIINASPDRTIQIGYEGEDRVTVLRFRYLYDWLSYGEGAFTVRVRRHGEHTAYNAQLVMDDRENTTLLMTVTNVELSVKGSGEMQVVYSGADFVKKSPIYSYNVSRAVDEAVDPPAQDVYTQIIESLSDLQTDVQGKADVQTVSALADEITDLNSDVQGLQTIVQGKADTQMVTALSDTVSGLQTAMQGKADVQTVTALSGTVSSLSDTTQQYMEYTNSAITDLQDNKASKSYVDGELATKANVQTVTALSGTVTDLQANKADKTYVDTELAGKASTAVATTSTNGLMSAQDKSKLDAVSLLKEQIYNSYPNIEAETASVVSITDGADDIPVKSLVVGIEPVQDLHGQDSPYPPGGGKNILSPMTSVTKNGVSIAVASDGTITVNGTATENTYLDAAASGVIPNNTTFYLYAFNPVASTDSNNMSVFLITDSGNPQVNLNSVNATTSYSYTSGDKQILRWRFKVPAGVAYTNFVLKPMFQIGGTAPTAYSPYSNICPITGWTGAVVERCGKNLLDIDRYGVRLPMTTNGITWTKVRDGVYHVQGTATGSSFFNISFNSPTNAMPCISFRGYRLFLSVTNPTVLVASEYFRRDGSYTQLSNGSVIPDEAVALRAYLKINPGITIDADFSVQLELGSTITSYEPYHADTYPITFPSEAGTVYGGSLDMTSGVLTVDRAMVDLGTLNYVYRAPTETKPIPRFVSPIVSGKDGLPLTEICSVYKIDRSPVYGGNVDYCLCVYNSSVYILDSRFTSASDFKTAMSGVQLVYELAEPITYQLTPTEVKTLLSSNNIWADTGDTSLAYRADTKLYVDGICADYNSMLAPVESTYIATRNYTMGKLLIVDNTLYKVTANIANGGTITAGTNVVSTTLSEVIASLS